MPKPVSEVALAAYRAMTGGSNRGATLVVNYPDDETTCIRAFGGAPTVAPDTVPTGYPTVLLVELEDGTYSDDGGETWMFLNIPEE